jgi:hypothetical protein
MPLARALVMLGVCGIEDLRLAQSEMLVRGKENRVWFKTRQHFFVNPACFIGNQIQKCKKESTFQLTP